MNTPTSVNPTPAPQGQQGAFPLAAGSRLWKPGDDARIGTMGNCHWVRVLSIYKGSIATCLSETGNIEYWSIGSLETRESYLASCRRMRDEWTGAHYRKLVELADRPFVKPAAWDEWMARATGNENIRNLPRDENA